MLLCRSFCRHVLVKRCRLLRGGAGPLSSGTLATAVAPSLSEARSRALSIRASFASTATQYTGLESQRVITDLHVQEAVGSHPLLEELGLSPLRMVRQNVTGKGRFYTSASRGDSFPSVTSVLDVLDKGPALQRWQIRQVLESVKEEVLSPGFELSPKALAGVVKRSESAPTRVMNVAADKGTSFHNIVEAIVRDGCLPPGGVPAHLVPGVDAFLRWSRSSGLIFESSGEVTVASQRYGYAGSMDALARCSRTGKLVALDWKTSSGIYNNHGMQVCAYAQALNEMISSSVDLSSGSGSAEGRSPQQVTSARVVRFDCRSGKFEDREVKDFSAAFKVFLAALFVFRNGKQKLI